MSKHRLYSDGNKLYRLMSSHLRILVRLNSLSSLTVMNMRGFQILTTNKYITRFVQLNNFLANFGAQKKCFPLFLYLKASLVPNNKCQSDLAQ